MGALLRSVTEGLFTYIAALSLDLQLGALLSDTWAVAGRVLRDFQSFADEDESYPDLEEDDENPDEDEEEEEDDSEDGVGSAGGSGPGSQGEEEVSNTLDEVPRPPGQSRADHGNRIGQSHGSSGWEQQSVDLEQSESGWQVYRKPEHAAGAAPGPQPVPPPMVSTSDDDVLRSDEAPPPPDEPPPPPQPNPTLNTSRLRPCDKRVDLYVLQPERLNASGTANPLKGKLTNCHATGCERPFSVQKIPHSNLILLVVDTLCPCGNKKLAIQPQEVVYEGASSSCKGRNPRDNLVRRRPPKCISYHPEEVEIHACGSATKQSLTASCAFLVLATLRHLGLAWLAS
ncbi:hypothetical protein FOCC_FOCC003124 [Frankliniella occidentalis]|nr:hypothetical protein FOCC_FOCC003124 [Frankliniella occidentalis]